MNSLLQRYNNISEPSTGLKVCGVQGIISPLITLKTTTVEDSSIMQNVSSHDRRGKQEEKETLQ